MKQLNFFILLSVLFPLLALAQGTVLKTEANRFVEVTLTAELNYTDPFNQVSLDAIFTDPNGQELRVPGFWGGGNTWKIRYSSAELGTHSFRSVCSGTDDKGLNGRTGKVLVRPYKGRNSLFKHGPLRIADDKRHFAYADGKPFFWLGDTWWMGLSKRLVWPKDVKTLAKDRSKKGFNVIQIVAGLYPDMPAFDERGENETGFPWEKDYASIRPEYFDAADQRIMFLAEQGLVPCIIGAWGYHLPWLGKEKMEKHWRYLIARWGALLVVWVAAAETTMPYYLSTTKEADGKRQKEEWTEIIRYIRETDPFHRILTTHPIRTARTSITDAAILDFDMHQSGHGSPWPKQAAQALEGWNDTPVMPIISGESRYEALAIPDPLPAAAARQAFWAHSINAGFAGHTYGANGVWQINGREHPFGKSPGGNNWGTIPWEEAMRLPGSTQLGAAKRFIESFSQWNHLEPKPGWVSSDSEKVAPLCAAVADQLRIIYLLSPGIVALHSLAVGSSYTAKWFDPVSGKTHPSFELKADSNGNTSLASPEGDQDWVLTLERKSR